MTEALMHEFYRRVDAGDVPGLVALFTSDAVYHRPGYPPVHGRSGMRHFYTHTRKIREGRHALDAVVVSGDEVAVRGSFAGVLHDGTPAKHRFAEFFTLAPDRTISRRETFFSAPLV
ncbi:nuclear transport factor 2 family protein [Streptomyces sp. SGAir0957]